MNGEKQMPFFSQRNSLCDLFFIQLPNNNLFNFNLILKENAVNVIAV